jgi:predicted PurR-regulated permease PerM
MVIAAMRYADLLLVPMVWALLLTLMVLPIAKWLERRIKYRALTAILTISIFVIIVGGVFFLFSTQALRLRGDGPLIEKKLSESMNDLREFVDSNLGVPFEQQPEVLKDRLSSASESVFQKVGNTVQSTLTGLGLMVIVPIYMFFFITYRDRFYRFVVMLVERRKQIQALDILSKASTVVQKYLVGVGIEVLIVFVLAATLFFSLGIRHALFFAVMVAVLNIIPYLGVLIGSSISVVYACSTQFWSLYCCG